MGKVLTSFLNGWKGSIARTLDDVVISLPNKSSAAIPYGVPVALNPAKNGVVPFDPNSSGAGHTAANFVGITVRTPAKTPDAYGADTGSYAIGDMVDILVRGHIIVELANPSSAGRGDVVSVFKSNGKMAVASGDSVVALNNVHVSTPPDTSNLAEVVLNYRNLI